MIKTTTIKIPSETLILIKTMAVEKGTSQNNIINELINKGLEKSGKSNRKIKAEVINNKMPFYNPEKKVDWEEVSGMVKLDHETDAVKLKNSIHTDKAGF